MKSCASWIVLFFLFASIVGVAGVLLPLTGAIMDFDERSVRMELENGKNIFVARIAFGKRQLRPGQKVELTIDPKWILVPEIPGVSKPK